MKKIGIATLLVLVSCLFPVSVKAQKACTQMACQDGLTLHVDPEREWKKGIYNFSFALGLKVVKCTGSLPLKPCEEGPSFRCDKPGITIGEIGCALPADQQAISDIHIDGTPRRLIVQVSRGGRPMVAHTISPKYQIIHPNGPQCGPVCTSASYDLFSTD